MYKINCEINKLPWVIKFVDEDDELDVNEDEPVVCGATWKQDLTICINETINSGLLLRTIVHELTHAYIWSYGFENVRYNEETLCNFMESYGREIVDVAGEILKKYRKGCNKD